jgi:hypothetical protein
MKKWNLTLRPETLWHYQREEKENMNSFNHWQFHNDTNPALYGINSEKPKINLYRFKREH